MSSGELALTILARADQTSAVISAKFALAEARLRPFSEPALSAACRHSFAEFRDISYWFFASMKNFFRSL